jgi:hypothetical protein
LTLPVIVEVELPAAMVPPAFSFVAVEAPLPMVMFRYLIIR